jgi:hypothetical protein
MMKRRKPRRWGSLWLIAVAIVGISFAVWKVSTAPLCRLQKLSGTIFYALDTRFPDTFLAAIRGGIRTGAGKGVYAVSFSTGRPVSSMISSSSAPPSAYRLVAGDASGILYERKVGRRYEYYRYQVKSKQSMRFMGSHSNGRLLWIDMKHGISITYRGGIILMRDNNSVRELFRIASVGTLHEDQWAAALSGDLKQMAVFYRRTVNILDVKTGKVIASVDGYSFAWSPGGSHLIAISSSEHITVYRLTDGALQTIATTTRLPGERVLCWHPKGRFLLTSYRTMDFYRLAPEATWLLVRDLNRDLCIARRVPAGGWGCDSAVWVE